MMSIDDINEIMKIIEKINEKHNIYLNPIASGYILLKLMSWYNESIENIEKKVKELDNMAGKENIGNKKEFFDLMLLTHLYKYKIDKIGSEKIKNEPN